MPLCVCLGFSLFTIGCFAFGPYLYDTPNPLLLYAYLTAVHLAVICGYYRGMLTVQKKNRFAAIVEGHQKVIFVLGFAATSLSAYVSFPTGGSITSSLQDTTAARAVLTEATSVLGGPIIGYSLAITTLFPLVSGLLVFARWKQCPLLYKVLGLGCWFNLLYGSVVGASRAGMWVGLVTIITAIMYRFRGRVPFALKVKMAAAVTAFLLFFTVYSTYIAESRAVKMDDYQTWLLAQNDMVVDSSHFIFDLPISPTYKGAMLQGLGYFGHGYYGLAYALSSSDWEWGCGIGNSPFLMRTVARIFGNDEWVDDRSWFNRLVKQGIITPSSWITAYPWIASDTTFLGSIFVMGWIGWLLGVSWRQCLEGWDLPALMLFFWAVGFLFHIYITCITESLNSVVTISITMMVYFGTRSRGSFTNGSRASAAQPAQQPDALPGEPPMKTMTGAADD